MITLAMRYAILRFKPIKTTQALGKAYNHNFRNTIAKNVDPDRIYKDKEIVKLKDADYGEAFKRRIKEGNVKTVGKNQTKAIEAILTFSDKLAKENFNLDKWIEMNVKWLNERFGKENVVSVVLHNDETAPHLHCIVIPVKDKKLAATELLESTPAQVAKHNGVYGYTFLQNEYAEYMTSLGLHRGITSSPATHEDLKDFRNALGEYSNNKLPEIEKNESIDDYTARINKIHRDAMIKAFKLIKDQERKIVELTGEIQNAPNNEAKLKENITALKRQVERATKSAITDEQKKQSEMMRHILLALRNNYPDAESRKANFDFLAELDKAGKLFEMGMTKSEVYENIDKDISEIDKPDINK